MQKALALAKALTFALIALPATGHEFKVGEITVGHPFAHPTANMAMAGAGYLTLTNSGDTADRLIAVEAAFPRVMLHGSVKTDGVARMIHLDNGVELLPGQTVEFAPGGLHVMFMGLDGDPFVERSEEHTSELQSPVPISYAVFCLKKKNNQQQQQP